METGKREYTVVIEQAEDGYLIGSLPALHACHTQGRSFDELPANVREVRGLCLEELGDEAQDPPKLPGIHRIAI